MKIEVGSREEPPEGEGNNDWENEPPSGQQTAAGISKRPQRSPDIQPEHEQRAQPAPGHARKGDDIQALHGRVVLDGLIHTQISLAVLRPIVILQLRI